MKKLLLSLMVVFSAVLASASAQTNPEIGVWKMNVAKSTFGSTAARQSMTLSFEAVGQGVKYRAEVVHFDGSKTAETYTANYDGKDVPLPGSTTADTVSVKRINATTVERTSKKGGKVVQTFTRVYSADGKSFTATGKSTNAQGQVLTDIYVLERQ